jgi:C-terminal processing protease CtpA/Prc
VPGGQAARFGVKENDKIISINNKSPRNVDDAVNIIKEAGKSIRLMLVRQEEVPGEDDFLECHTLLWSRSWSN